MLRKIIILLILITFCNIHKISAHYGIQGGCYRSSNGYIYFTTDGYYSGKPNYESSSSSSDRILRSSTYCYSAIGGSNSCRVGGGSGNWGVLYSFYFFPCPIDDYIPLVLVTIGGFGCIIIRKRMLNSFFYS